MRASLVAGHMFWSSMQNVLGEHFYHADKNEFVSKIGNLLLPTD